MKKTIIILAVLCLSLLVGCKSDNDTWKIVPDAEKLTYNDLYEDSSLVISTNLTLAGSNTTNEEYIFYPAKDDRVIVYHVRVTSKANLLEDDTQQITGCRAISIKKDLYDMIETAYNDVPDGQWEEVLPNLDNAKAIKKSIKKMTQ